MNLSNKKYDLSFLTSEFEKFKFELFASSDNLFMTCIACWCDRASDIVEDWNGIQSIISIYFQPPGNLAKWNIYFVVFCPELLPIRDKYSIQNNRFALRKVVLDGLVKLPTLAEAEVIINNELLGADLSIVEVAPVFQKPIDAQLAMLVKGAPSDMTAASKSIRSGVIKNIINSLN